VSRARESDVVITSNVEAIVVGDTPLDVQCAIVGGARSVAVCTGSYGEYELREAGADSVLPDLTDPERFIRLILG
jgi:phosphoglycolate phosphatase-like HAD superfamily hydrolase